MLGELEQIVLLAVLRVGDAAYGVPVHEEIVRLTKRDLTLGTVGWDELIHVAYLLGVMALGVWFTARRLERKLLK